MNIRKVVDNIIKEQNCCINLKIDIMPTFRFGHGLYEVISDAQKLAFERGIELNDISGDMSDEPDRNFLEFSIAEDEVDFWIEILENYTSKREYPDDVMQNIKETIKCARNLDFWFLRLEQ